MKIVINWLVEIGLVMALVISIIRPNSWATTLVIAGVWMAIAMMYWIILAAILVMIMGVRRHELREILWVCFAYSKFRMIVWVGLSLVFLILLLSSSTLTLSCFGVALLCYYLAGQSLNGTCQ